jgi:hypothetical protein
MFAPVRQGWKFLTGAKMALRRDREAREIDDDSYLGMARNASTAVAVKKSVL